MRLAIPTRERTIETANAGTAIVTVVTVAGTFEETCAEAATETTVDATIAVPVQAEVTMTDTDAAARATDTAEGEGIEAATTTAAEVVPVRALRAATGHAARGKGLPSAEAVRCAKQVAVRRLSLQKQLKTIVTSVLSLSSRFRSVPRHAISALSSRSSDPSWKPKSSRTASPAAQRGKVAISWCKTVILTSAQRWLC
jgi:hypothetical protein